MPRRRPRVSELRQLVRFRAPGVPTVARRLARAHTIEDLREQGRRRTPRAVFDYVDGAAEAEISLRRARDAFAAVEFSPSVLHDVREVDMSTTIARRRSPRPYLFAPTGFTRMMHVAGERAVGAVAERLDIPYALSTMGTTSLEELATAIPQARRWFQLYVWRDRAAAENLVVRAREAGYEALVLTVDVPVAGARLRDVRNGFTIPPALTARTVLDMARRPRWWSNLLTSEPLEFASFRSWDGPIAELLDSLFDPTMTLDDLAWVRSLWPGHLVVKGIQGVDDARRVIQAGADSVVVSNHGGRQLDRAPVPLRLLPQIRDEVGSDAELLVDTGVMTGADVVAGIAAGADGVMVGRAYLYGLMAGGEAGVARAVEILDSEVRRTMQLLGVTRIGDLSPRHVHLGAAHSG